jgi:SNF2 family DNA or RNA helicase
LKDKNKPIQPGVTVAREPLSQAQIARFLGSQRQKIKVLHNEFIDAISLDNMAIIGAENMITSLEEEEPHGEISTEFWNLRAKLSVVIDAMPSYADACKSLKYSLNEAAREQLSIRYIERRNTSSVMPNPWQVVAAAWMKIQEAGPIKGELLALDCGLGKTISTLIHITKQAEIIETQFQAGKAIDCRATLILCSNSIVDVWYKEWRTFFRNMLYFRQFYGSVTNDLNITRKEITLPSNTKIARKKILKAFPPINSKTTRLLVVCSYETWGKRTLFANTIGEERRELRERITRISGE